MNRRSFFRSLALGLASLPFCGKLFAAKDCIQLPEKVSDVLDGYSAFYYGRKTPPATEAPWLRIQDSKDEPVAWYCHEDGEWRKRYLSPLHYFGPMRFCDSDMARLNGLDQ